MGTWGGQGAVSEGHPWGSWVGSTPTGEALGLSYNLACKLNQKEQDGREDGRRGLATGAGGKAGLEGGSEPHQAAPGSLPQVVPMGPAERPHSSPRPDIGEVYNDGVLLVWKPVESCGPVTYTVQCSLEGTPCALTPGGSWGQCGVASGNTQLPCTLGGLCGGGMPWALGDLQWGGVCAP